LASDFVFREDSRYNFSIPIGNTQLTEGSSEQLCHCVPGEAGDMYALFE